MPAPPRPPGLPDFGDPPVAEVVLGVQVDPLPKLRNPQVGQLWVEQFRAEFPRAEERHPLGPAEEVFEDEPRGGVFKVELSTDEPPLVLRQWFITADDTRVLQVQQDRFMHNWRRQSPADPYPRYEHIREDFERHYTTFLEFLSKNELGAPTIRQAEINYVNQLKPDAVWSEQGQLDRVLRVWRPDFGTESLLTDPVEDVRILQRHRITGASGPFARLYVAVDPVVGGDLVIKLTVRGRPVLGSLGAALEFFDMGRDRIVKAFTALTTDRMHDRWDRKKP